MEQIKADAETEFKGRWGWIDLAVQVRENNGQTFNEVMQSPIVEVLTFATYLIEKVEITKMRYGNTGASAS